MRAMLPEYGCKVDSWVLAGTKTDANASTMFMVTLNKTGDALVHEVSSAPTKTTW